MTTDSAVKSAYVERPLTPSARLVVVLSATAVVLLAYLYFMVSLAIILITLAADFIVLIGLIRFGAVRIMVGPLNAMGALASLVFKSLFFSRDDEVRIRLTPESSPRLFDLIHGLANRMGADPPAEVYLDMSDTASIGNSGYRTGRGRSVLTIGYDLLATLTETEFEAVIAHELSHTKLAQRAHSNWLSNGVARICRLTAGLGSVREDARAEGKKFYSASVLLLGAMCLAKGANRLLSTYRRQEEFDADRLASDTCGAHAMRNWLVRLAVVGENAGRIGWRARLIQLQKDGSFTEWLRDHLLPSDDERAEIEAQMMSRKARGPFDTHPILSDRLAALPDSETREDRSAPAVFLLEAPDKMAADLVSQFEDAARKAERKYTELVRKKAKSQVPTRLAPIQCLGAVLVVLGIIGIAAPICVLAEGESLLLVALYLLWPASFIVPGLWLLGKRFGYKDRMPLPVPSLTDWKSAHESPVRCADVREWGPPLESRLISEMPAAIRGSKAVADYWASRCYEALGKCDFQQALVASRLCLKTRKRCFEGLLGNYVSAVYFGLDDELRKSNNLLWQTYGIVGSVNWAYGWAFVMVGDWVNAEKHLLEAASKDGRNPRLLAYLGLAQCAIGKIHEACESLQESVSLSPGVSEHRIVLARALLASGLCKDALRHLDALDSEAKNDRRAMMSRVRACLLLGRRDEARANIDAVLSAHQGAQALVEVGDAFAEANLHDEASAYFEAACDQGFCPAALVGLSFGCYSRKDYAGARAGLLSALDLTREPVQGVAGPLEVMADVFNGLSAMAEPMEGCSSQVAHLDIRYPAGQYSRLSLLVCGVDSQDRFEQVRTIYEAMQPGESLSPMMVAWEEVPKAQQPEGWVTPGVHSWQLGPPVHNDRAA